MNVGIIGAGGYAEARAQAVEALPGMTLKGVLREGALDGFLDEVDAVFVTVPTAEHARVAEAATKRGVHVFLEWPPATSIRECQAIIRLSEEASVEVGVSRPLRFHSVFEAVPVDWRASLMVVRRDVPVEVEVAWPRWLADAIDLCCALAQSGSVLRIDAEAIRNTAAWPDAIAFGLRFHSSAYAQVSIRRTKRPAGGAFYAAGGGFAVDVDIDLSENDTRVTAYQSTSPIERETQAFLRALSGEHSTPVSILDGLHTMRLVERLMEKLR